MSTIISLMGVSPGAWLVHWVMVYATSLGCMYQPDFTIPLPDMGTCERTQVALQDTKLPGKGYFDHPESIPYMECTYWRPSPRYVSPEVCHGY